MLSDFFCLQCLNFLSCIDLETILGLTIFIFIASKVEAYGQEEQFSGRNLLLEIPTFEALWFGSSKYMALTIEKKNIAVVDQRLVGQISLHG